LLKTKKRISKPVPQYNENEFHISNSNEKSEQEFKRKPSITEQQFKRKPS
jgi:hypothetical protein